MIIMKLLLRKKSNNRLNALSVSTLFSIDSKMMLRRNRENGMKVVVQR